MYNAKYIIPGLIIFALLFTFPFWYNLGAVTYEPVELELPEDFDDCIESTEFMRTEHMKLLDEWRDIYVRDGYQLYWSELKEQYFLMSLTKTCMDCHDNKEDFCDRCHDQTAVDPYCWDCHHTEP